MPINVTGDTLAHRILLVIKFHCPNIIEIRNRVRLTFEEFSSDLEYNNIYNQAVKSLLKAKKIRKQSYKDLPPMLRLIDGFKCKYYYVVID